MDPELARQGAIAAEHVFALLMARDPEFRFDVSTPQGFDDAVSFLAGRWSRVAPLDDAATIAQFTRELDVDWSALSPARRQALIDRAATRAQIPLGKAKPIVADMGLASKAVYRGTLERLGKAGLKVAASFDRYDKRVPAYVTKASAHFVTAADGYVSRSYSRIARAVVEESVIRGMGRRETGRLMRDTLGVQLGRLNDHYWATTAGAFVSHSRSWSQMAGYASAGVDRYLVLSVLDERTTEFCRMIDGRTFEVPAARAQFRREEQAEPGDALKRVAPWVRERRGEDGRTELYARGTTIARVDQPGYGTTQPGSYLPPRGSPSIMTPGAMQGLGLSFPPYHGLCRTTTIPDVSTTVSVPGPATPPPPAPAPAKPKPAPRAPRAPRPLPGDRPPVQYPTGAIPTPNYPSRAKLEGTRSLTQRESLAVVQEELRRLDKQFEAVGGLAHVDYTDMQRLQRELGILPNAQGMMARKAGVAEIKADTVTMTAAERARATRAAEEFWHMSQRAIPTADRGWELHLWSEPGDPRAYHSHASHIRSIPGRRSIKFPGTQKQTTINVGANDRRVMFHEMGHWLERRNKRVAEASRAWVRSRTRGERARRLSAITGNPNYAAHEVAKPDRFISPYVGKDYGEIGRSEAISMGLENFSSTWRMRTLARDDPEHFSLCVAILRGRFGWLPLNSEM